MVPTTRATLRTPFQSVLEALEATDDDSNIRHAFEQNGISTVEDVLDLPKQDLRALTFTTNETVDDEVVESEPKTLKLVEANRILLVRQWFQAQDDASDSVFDLLDAETLKTFRRISVQSAPRAFGASTQGSDNNDNDDDTIQTVAAVATHRPSTLVADFRRGVKRDMSAFADYKDAKKWNVWYRSFVATARAQGLSNVLDRSYVPVTQEEAALFTMEVGYLWAVFTKVLKEPRAAKLV